GSVIPGITSRLKIGTLSRGWLSVMTAPMSCSAVALVRIDFGLVKLYCAGRLDGYWNEIDVAAAGGEPADGYFGELGGDEATSGWMVTRPDPASAPAGAVAV